MANEKESKECKDADTDMISTPRINKVPLKMAPPAYAPESKMAAPGGDPTTRKKALPPPSNPPPKSGNSAAAFRSKSSLTPPIGPPPSTGAPSASVAKIRSAARPHMSGVQPGGIEAKTGPLNGAQLKPMGPPSTPPMITKSNAGGASQAIAPPKAALNAINTARNLNSEKKGDVTDTPAEAFNSKQSLPLPSKSFSESMVPPRSAPFDILANDSPLNTKTIESSAAILKPSTLNQRELSTVLATPVLKSGGNVIEDTTMANRHGSGTITSLALEKENASVFTTKMGKAAQFSGQLRLNVPEEEFIVVKKRESKSAEAETTRNSGSTIRSIANFDDTFDDVEEIPFLEDDNFNTQQNEAKYSEHDDDPEISIEYSRRFSKTSQDSTNEHNDDDSDTTVQRNVSNEDLYDDLRRTKHRSQSSQGHEYSGSEHDEQETRDSRSPAYDKREEISNEGSHDEFRKARDRDKTREKRKEKRRSKQDGPKKVQAQFFNPKNAPHIPDHLLEFIKRPLECGRGQIVKCFIERNDSGPNKLAPIYTLLLEVNSSSGRPILYARKNATSRITSHYVISMNKDDLILSRKMRSHQYVGKLRSSTNMMEYTLYDQGDNPEDLDSDCEVDDELRQSIRAELAMIRYHYSKKPYPRKMEVVIPAMEDNGQSYLEWRPLSRDQMMEEHVRTIASAGGQNVIDASNFIFLHKRETKYDPLSSCIVDFRSRATCVSVKNFQLVHSEPTNEEYNAQYRHLYPEYVYEDQGTISLPQEFVLLQLGKVGKDCFNMDFQYPLSMLQAFAISLSRFDTKQR
ncbi:putative tubby-like protein [Plasmopara halstedii]